MSKWARRPVVVDLQAVQSPGTAERGIGHYAADWALSLEEHSPDLVEAYLLNPAFLPPGNLEVLAATGKLHYANEPGVLDEPPEIYHLASPFDLDARIGALLPNAVRDARALSATVYDLLPHEDLEQSLVDPVERHAWRARLILVRNADALFTLSAAVAAKLAPLVRRDALVANVGAAASRSFVELATSMSETEVTARLHGLGLTDDYVLYPSGSHPRKNNEALVRAFAGLDEELRRGLRLVITGALDASTAHHYDHLAAAGRAPGAVLTTGHVEEPDLVALYRRARLVCVASLGEGFGLPVVEAGACGVPVVCSDRSPFDELVGETARFDPTSTGAITAALKGALRAPRGATTAATTGAATTWTEVARSSLEGFEALLSRGRHRRVATRPRPVRVALVSPLPPAPSGVASYSYRLLEALAKEGLEVEAFTDGPTPAQLGPPGVTTRRVAALRATEALTGRYDAVVYALGNSHHHLGALTALRARPGVVLAHDVRLTNLYRFDHGDPHLPRAGFERAARAVYRGQDLGPGPLDAEHLERRGLLLAREVIEASTRYLVGSREAAARARIEAPGMTDRIAVLPFALAGADADLAYLEEARPAPYANRPSLALWGAGPEGLDRTARRGVTVLSHFGIVDRKKCPELAISALALVRARAPQSDPRLVFVGPIADALVGELSEQAEREGVEHAVFFTGPLPAFRYASWLDRAEIALQLRAKSNGEASAAVGECLSAGLPTIVSGLGWFAELGDAVVMLERNGREELAGAIEDLLDNNGRRAALSGAARSLASARTFSATAKALRHELGL